MYQIISEDVTLFTGDAILNSLGYGPDRVVDAPGGVFRSILGRVKDPESLKKDVLNKGANLDFKEAFITDSYGLDCKKIVHAISPYRFHDDDDMALLQKTYSNALQLAYDSGIRSICLPLIGTGANGYSSNESFIAAKRAAYHFQKEHDDFDVCVTVFWGDKPLPRRHRRVDEVHYGSNRPFSLIPEATGSEARSAYREEERFLRKQYIEKQKECFGIKPIKTREIDMESLPLEVGDSFGRLIDLFIFAREGTTDKSILPKCWEEIAMNIGDAKDDYFDDDTWFGGNSKYQWHKHANAKKGHKKNPVIPKGEEDPDGVWNTPKKLSILLVACALEMSRKQTEFMFRFCGYYLSKYSKEDLAIRACFEFLATDEEEASILNVYQIYSTKAGKIPFVKKK